jgi:hypothetical protein
VEDVDVDLVAQFSGEAEKWGGCVGDEGTGVVLVSIAILVLVMLGDSNVLMGR